jgi:phosphatidylglycerophosphatase A
MNFYNNYIINFRSFFVKFFATCFGLGYAPIFPGAVGVGFGIIIAYLIHPFSFWQEGLITLALIIFAIPLTTEAEKLFQKKDCKKIIIDEVIGVLVATIWFSHLSSIMFLVIFFLYGLFDAIKVFPANIIERLYGGWGIVFDDIVAGGYTAIAIVLFLKILIIL